ncbi:MAG: methyltransferase domain-containing protein [Saprospiraceae bacterium]
MLAQVLEQSTKELIERNGPIVGQRFLDLGCGGGDVALMAAKLVGEKGQVIGIDFDEEIIRLAQEDALREGIKQVMFESKGVYNISFSDEFDISYARFLFSHLTQPEFALHNMINATRPGGRILVEDVDFDGHFSHPPSASFDAYLKYYVLAAQGNGQNPQIGPTLVSLFHYVGLQDVGFEVIQPSFNSGPGKWMAHFTLEKIKDSVVNQKIATHDEISIVQRELEEFTRNEQTILSLPRIFRVWGTKKG